MQKLSFRQNPAGVIGVAVGTAPGLDALDLPDNPLLLVVEGIEKPGNLGAMLRTAEAAGVDAVLIAGSSGDLYNPNTIRASQGAVFAMGVAVGSTVEITGWCESHGIKLFAARDAADLSLWQVEFEGPVAIAIGAEASGLTDQWDEVATGVSIPMEGDLDSLNASTAAAILLYEAVRQRTRGSRLEGRSA